MGGDPVKGAVRIVIGTFGISGIVPEVPGKGGDAVYSGSAVRVVTAAAVKGGGAVDGNLLRSRFKNGDGGQGAGKGKGREKKKEKSRENKSFKH